MRTVVGVEDAARRVARGRRPIAGVPAPWMSTIFRGLALGSGDGCDGLTM